MSSYAITFYAREDITFGRDEDGEFTVTVKEGATPETIKIVDGDKGDAGNTFSGSTARGEDAVEHNQAAYGKSNGTTFDGDPIQPLAALPGNDNPDDQIMAIGVGEPTHTIGYGFTYEPVPGETVSFNYDGYDAAPSYDSSSLYVEEDSESASSSVEDDEAGVKEEGSGPSGKDDDEEDGSGPSGTSGPSGGGSGPSSPPCFTRGTEIRTASGEVRVEDLTIGDMIWTEGHGLQPIRWICQRIVPAKGDFAPIRICAGTLGAVRDILVSPAHRMLLQGPEIELLFGVTKALVAAKDLLNDQTILRETTLETVEYFHILFDQHEVLEAHGTLSESFFPHAATVEDFGAEQRKELFALFPELARGSDGYAVAYPGLLAHEVSLIQRQGS